MTDFQQRLQIELPSVSKIFTPGVIVFLVLYILGYALLHYATDFTVNQLGLSASGLLTGKVWQLVTYSILEGCSGSLAFDILVLLLVGSTIEREWRTKSFFLLWLVISVVCGLVWVLINFLFRINAVGIGGGAFIYGLVAVFGLIYRKKKFFAFFWTVEAQHLALFIIGIGLVVAIPQPILWVWVGGALVGFVYVKLRWNFQRSRSPKPRFSASARSEGFVDLD